MSLDYPWLLLLLLLAVPAVLLWIRSARRREERIKRFAESNFTGQLFVGHHPKLRRWHFLLFVSAITVLLLAANGPQIGGGKQKVTVSGIDIMIVLDVSNSMRATDLQPNRIERARLSIQKFIRTLGSDRIGVVVFAGQAYTSLPLTDDHSAAEMVMESVSPQMLSMQGTAIGAAIEQAVSSFPKEDKDRGKAIIVISDGENHEDDAAEAAAKAAEDGVIVSAIGIGSSTGEKIPEYDDDGVVTGNKRDENGQEVITKLDEGKLKEMVNAGKGIYVHASAADLGLNSVYTSLQGLSKGTKETWEYTSFTPLFPWLVAIAILLLIIEPLLPEGKRNENKTQNK